LLEFRTNKNNDRTSCVSRKSLHAQYLRDIGRAKKTIQGVQIHDNSRNAITPETVTFQYHEYRGHCSGAIDPRNYILVESVVILSVLLDHFKY